jgi:hypothetical protein
LPHANPLVKACKGSVARALAVGVGVLVLAGCGSDGGDSTATWSGPPRANAAGHVPVSGFNDFLAGDGKAFARSPVAAVAEFLALDRSSAVETTVVATSPGEVRNFSEVVATLDGLLDDSVRAARYTVELQRDKNGLWRLRAVDWAQRCQPGRGHQSFSAESCV